MFCRHCGVELEPHLSVCPLCGGREISPDGVTLSEYAALPDEAEIPAMRRIAFRLISLVLATAAAVVLVIDLVAGGGLTWSPVVLYALGTAWVLGAVPTVPGMTPGKAFLLDVLAITLLLFGIYAAGWGSRNWFFELALPLVLVVSGTAVVLVFVVRRAPGVVRGAVAMVWVGGVCAGIDLVIRNYEGLSLRLSWSAVVLYSVLSGAVFLFLLHVTVLRFVDMRRRFHL